MKSTHTPINIYLTYNSQSPWFIRDIARSFSRGGHSVSNRGYSLVFTTRIF